MAKELKRKRILVTGPTGQVGLPIALALAKQNDVWGLARFSDPKIREQLDLAGVTCVSADLATSDFGDVPERFDYVLNFAVTKGGNDDWDRDIAANAEAVGLLMARCRDVKAFLHCSTTGVYQHQGPEHALTETDPLGDNHRVMMPTYSLAKISAEAVARTIAREHDIPTVITRLNVPYGDNGGWPYYHLLFMKSGAPIPLHTEKPNRYNPIHEDDLIRQLPAMLDAASVPATIVNWGGEPATIEQWCAYLGELTGMEPKFEETADTIGSVTVDLTKMHKIAGKTKVDWRDGMKRMVEAREPDLLKREEPARAAPEPEPEAQPVPEAEAANEIEAEATDEEDAEPEKGVDWNAMKAAVDEAEPAPEEQDDEGDESPSR